MVAWFALVVAVIALVVAGIAWFQRTVHFRDHHPMNGRKRV